MTFGDEPHGVRQVSASVADEISSCESPMSAEEISAAEEYVPLHGNFGISGREIVKKEEEFKRKFKVFLPPGTYYLNLKIYIENDADVYSHTRFGKPPEISTERTSSGRSIVSNDQIAPSHGVRFDQIRNKTMRSHNGDGLINIAQPYNMDSEGDFLFFNENEAAGWVYVELEGSGKLYYIWFEIWVMPEIYNSWYSTLSSWDEVENVHGMWNCREENTQTLRQLRSDQNPSEIDTGTVGTNSSSTPTHSTHAPSSSTTTPSTSTGTCQGETPYSDTPFSGGEVLLTGPEGSGHWQYKTNPGHNETCWWHCGKDGVRVSGKNACKPRENENQGRTCETPDGTYPEGPRTVSYYYDETKVTYYAACD